MTALLELKKNFLFNGLSDDEVSDFVSDYFHKIVEYSANECIISKDEPSKYLGLVIEGSLGIYSESKYGDHTLIGIGDEKYFFGFIPGFLGNANSITSLYSREYCKIAYFFIGNSDSSLEDFLSKINSKIILNMFAMLSLHIRNDFDRMHIISSPYVRVRYASFLLHNCENQQSLELTDRFTRSELANYLGVYRTSLSRVISEMAEAGLIAVDGKKITILRPDDLRSILS